MSQTVRLLVFGVLVWAVPFGLSMAIWNYQIIDVQLPLFDTVVTLICALTGLFFAYAHLERLAAPTFVLGLIVGSVWAAISVALDSPFFIFGMFGEQMTMPLDYYIGDIGVTYLLYPMSAAFIGAALGRN
jgi:hypothetical protein